MPPIIQLSNDHLDALAKDKIYHLDDLFQYGNEEPKKMLVLFSELTSKTHNLAKENSDYLSQLKESITKNAQTLLDLKKITQEELLYCAYINSDIRQCLVHLKLISMNDYLTDETLKVGDINQHYLYAPLFFIDFYSVKSFKELLDLDVDFSLKTQSNHLSPNSTIYDIAIKNKQRSVIKELTAILPNHQLLKLEEPLLIEFKNEKDYKKQHKILIKAINENNQEILKELINNCTLYEKALLYTKSVGKNLLQYAIEFGQLSYTKAFMDLNIYDKNNKPNFCYALFALEKNQPKLGMMVYENGYFNAHLLKERLLNIEGFTLDNKIIELFTQELIENNEKVNLEVLLAHGFHHIFEAYIEIYQPKIAQFFEDNPHIPKLAKLSDAFYHKTSSYDGKTPITQNKMKFIFKLIKYLQINENESSSVEKKSNLYLEQYLDSINQNTDEKWLMLCLKIGLNILPEKEKMIISSIKHDNLKIKFEKKLFENLFTIDEDEIIIPKKKIKI